MEITKVQLEDINKDSLRTILSDIGAFEIVGSSIQDLLEITDSALADTKKLLGMPIEKLRKLEMKDYHGFHDVLKLSEEKNELVNQIAFHIKSGQNRIAIDNFSFNNIYTYFNKVLDILNTLYSTIAKYFIDIDRVSKLGFDTQSVLTMRRYYENKIEHTNIVGIPAHCDYGLLTMITSDVNGLEVKIDNEYQKCEFAPNYRYYVIVGDWLRLQLGEGFTSGDHFVPTVEQERHSLSVFLNPPTGEKLDSQINKKDSKLREKLSAKLKTSLY